MKVIQSPSFAKRIKKFKKSHKEQLDNEIRLLIGNPQIGEGKKGDPDTIVFHPEKVLGKG